MQIRTQKTCPPHRLAGLGVWAGLCSTSLACEKRRAIVETDLRMTKLIITAGPYTFDARLETEAAPKTCAAFSKHLPFKSQVVHVRWSGEGVWIPLGDLDFGVGYENHTSYPAPGQIILYPGGISETEILLAYGGVRFASKMGQLAGNHFITLTSGLENLLPLGKLALWKGAQDIVFERA